jgi:hypothetical protein
MEFKKKLEKTMMLGTLFWFHCVHGAVSIWYISDSHIVAIGI